MLQHPACLAGLWRGPEPKAPGTVGTVAWLAFLVLQHWLDPQQWAC
jgi:phosphatidylglycerophosphatase A